MADDDDGARDEPIADGAVHLLIDGGGAGKGGLRVQGSHANQGQQYPHWSLLAVASRSFARSMSLEVMPPASCVVRSTVTRL